MTDKAAQFYNSTAWKNCRAAYKKSVGGLCELCLAEGIYNPGVIVHHKEHISPDNIDDPEILLCFDNLQLVCREHHAKEHREMYRPKRMEFQRYYIDEAGRCIVKED